MVTAELHGLSRRFGAARSGVWLTLPRMLVISVAGLSFVAQATVLNALPHALDRVEGQVERPQASPEAVAAQVYEGLIELGEAAMAEGNLARALQVYQRALGVVQARLLVAPGDSAWLRGLSVSHDLVGDVQRAQGELGAALKSYRAGLVIAQALAGRDPGNAEWQRDLSVSLNKIGGLQSLQGDVAGALKSLQAALDICRVLAEHDPDNAELQTEAAAAFWNLAQLDSRVLPKSERRALLERGLQALEALQQRGRLAPDKRHWPDGFRRAMWLLE
ncbi:hypothetical protein [uncultured Sphaerotilus sp.]|uniref:hypothetical protein n=1 Tax=uncultured Sphaerotilus sp. TaxID=474984 RepID=UPI0030CA4471